MQNEPYVIKNVTHLPPTLSEILFQLFRNGAMNVAVTGSVTRYPVGEKKKQ